MSLYTEAEAAERWCPYGAGTRHMMVTSSDGSVERYADKTTVACIGSRCMAWRWADHGERVGFEDREITKPPGEVNPVAGSDGPRFSNTPDGYHVWSYGGMAYTARKTVSRLPPRGYCGAFGKGEP